MERREQPRTSHRRTCAAFRPSLQCIALSLSLSQTQAPRAAAAPAARRSPVVCAAGGSNLVSKRDLIDKLKDRFTVNDAVASECTLVARETYVNMHF
jgi:hypothetical protein